MRANHRLTLLALCTLLAACNPSAPIAATTSAPQSTQSFAARTQPRSSRHVAPVADAVPGTFDFYLLTLSWSPEFCATHSNDASAAAECASPTGFVLHGLWPQNNDGSYPQHCSQQDGPRNPAAFADIFPDAHLLRHEWQTHGTCTGLAPEAYFQTARRALHSVAIPAELQHPTIQLTLTPDAILTDFARANPSAPPTAFALTCGHNYLTAVEECLNKAGNPIACPAVRTCHANVVKVTPGR